MATGPHEPFRRLEDMAPWERELAALRTEQDRIIREAFANGDLEPCNTGSQGGRYVACHRGGIGCPREHPDDPPELRRHTRRQARRRGLLWSL